jgi:hypothetical protein
MSRGFCAPRFRGPAIIGSLYSGFAQLVAGRYPVHGRSYSAGELQGAWLARSLTPRQETDNCPFPMTEHKPASGAAARPTERVQKPRRRAVDITLTLDSITLAAVYGKAIFVTGRGGPYGCETSSLPHFLDNRLADGDEVVSLTRRPPFTPRKIPGTHFC